MKKSLIAIMVVLSMVCSMFASPFAEEPTEDKCDLGSGIAGNTTGWWCTDQVFVDGVCAIAFTAPKSFTGMEIGLSCGIDAPVNFTLYRYIDSTEDTLTRKPLWSNTVTVSGDHVTEDTLVRCDFDKVYGAGRYVFAVRYGADTYGTDKHLIIRSTGACQDPSLDVEVFVRNLNVNGDTQEGVLCRLVLSNAAPEYKPEDEPAREYVDLSTGAVNPAWWCNEFNNVPGYFAFAFTSPKAFIGIELALYCGANAPVKFSLYQYENSLDETLLSEPVWTESQKISGNHTGPNRAQYAACDFGSVIEAGRYALKIEYDAPALDADKTAYFVVGAATAPNAALNIEQTSSGLGIGEAALDPNATVAGRLETVEVKEEEPELEYLEFFTGNPTTGWWCSDQAHLSGYYAAAFTSPSNFTGMEVAMYCGTNVPVKFSLYQYKDSIEKSLAGDPIWTESQKISGDHVGPGRENYAVCDFDMVLGAGRYVFKIEYDADEYDIYAHFVVGAAASSGNADLDIEIAAPGLNVSPLEADATFAGRLVITDEEADYEPDEDPSDEDPKEEDPVVEEEKCDLGGSIAGNTTGWWISSQDVVAGEFAVAFTAPKAFSGMELAMSCGANTPVVFSLYQFDTSIEKSIGRAAGRAAVETLLWTTTMTVNGNHTTEDDLVRCDFDKVYGAGRYVFTVRYGAEEYIVGSHLVVNSTGACEDASLNVEVWFTGMATDESTQDGFAGALVLSDKEPEYDPGEYEPGEEDPVEEEERCDLGSGFAGNTTGWWISSQDWVNSEFAVAFTSPKAFSGMMLAMSCGNNTPVEFSLYEFDGSIEKTIGGTPLWSNIMTVNGNHTTEDDLVRCDFDKVYGAGRYVFVVRYGAEEYIVGSHLVVNSTGACEDPSLNVVIWSTMAINETSQEGFAGSLILSNADPDYVPKQNNAGTADSSMLFAAVVALAAVVTVVVRKKKEE